MNLSFRGEVTKTTLFASFDEAKASVRQHGSCIFEIHERLLARTLGACLRDAGPERVGLEGLSPDVIELLLARGGRIGATFTGITGDCGSASPAFYLYSNRIDPAKLPREEAAYRSLAATRQVVTAVRGTTITSSPTVMTTSFALDGRTLCPPFFPVGRGQDLLFGYISRRCFPDCFFGHLPATTSHLPTDARSIDPARLWWLSPHSALFQSVRLAVEIAGAGIEVAAWGAPRLRLFGRRLVELASLPWTEFERLVRDESWRSAERAAMQVESLVRAVEPSHPWARDARAFAAARLSVLAEPHHLQPSALEQGRSPELARDLLQRLLRRYGELMEAWPRNVRRCKAFEAAKRVHGPTTFHLKRRASIIAAQPIGPVDI